MWEHVSEKRTWHRSNVPGLYFDFLKRCRFKNDSFTRFKVQITDASEKREVNVLKGVHWIIYKLHVGSTLGYQNKSSWCIIMEDEITTFTDLCTALAKAMHVCRNAYAVCMFVGISRCWVSLGKSELLLHFSLVVKICGTNIQVFYIFYKQLYNYMYHLTTTSLTIIIRRGNCIKEIRTKLSKHKKVAAVLK